MFHVWSVCPLDTKRNKRSVWGGLPVSKFDQKKKSWWWGTRKEEVRKPSSRKWVSVRISELMSQTWAQRKIPRCRNQKHTKRLFYTPSCSSVCLCPVDRNNSSVFDFWPPAAAHSQSAVWHMWVWHHLCVFTVRHVPPGRCCCFRWSRPSLQTLHSLYLTSLTFTSHYFFFSSQETWHHAFVTYC